MRWGEYYFGSIFCFFDCFKFFKSPIFKGAEQWIKFFISHLPHCEIKNHKECSGKKCWSHNQIDERLQVMLQELARWHGKSGNMRYDSSIFCFLTVLNFAGAPFLKTRNSGFNFIFHMCRIVKYKITKSVPERKCWSHNPIENDANAITSNVARISEGTWQFI